jgi:Glutamine phosphoribosylpyrophosphate amidotransferase
MRKVKGAYSLLILREKQLIAIRDPYGFRPLALGKNRFGSYFVASESCAFDIVDAEYLRDINPGEVLVIDDAGIRSYYPFEHTENPKNVSLSLFTLQDRIAKFLKIGCMKLEKKWEEGLQESIQ